MVSIFKIGKTHVPHRKNTAEMPAVRMTAPGEVLIPMSQHIGAPANPIVKAGDKVYVGTMIGEAVGFVSSPVFSSVSGTVKKIENYLLSGGKSCPAVRIESDGEMAPDPALAPPSVESFEDLSLAARNSGLVGLGGAGFPTAVKLDAKKIGSIDTLLINAAECEPYITSDTRTMLDEGDWLSSGVALFEKTTDIKNIVFGIESNKPECIHALRERFAGDDKVSVTALPSTYPQGGEKILVYNSLGRIVPEGGLPSDVGVIVMNVTTLAFLAKYVATGMPLVEKCVTVDGSAVASPKNIIAPIGASLQDVFEAAGGFSSEPGKVLWGGPMMGIAVYDLSYPILKNTNAILAFNEKDSRLPKTTACIHCGRCIAKCPMGLNPTSLAKAMQFEGADERAERLTEAKLNLCIECGSCSYVCPAKRPLVENNRIAKGFMRQYSEAQKKLAERK